MVPARRRFGYGQIWAKAVGLTLLQIAKAQKRPFYGIHFGGPRTIKCFDFRDPKNATVEKVIEFAEHSSAEVQILLLLFQRLSTFSVRST